MHAFFFIVKKNLNRNWKVESESLQSNLHHLSLLSVSSSEVFTAIYLMDFFLEHFLFISIPIFCKLFFISITSLFFSNSIISQRDYKCEVLYFLFQNVGWVREGSPLRDGDPKLDSWLCLQRMGNTLSIFWTEQFLLMPLNGILPQCKSFLIEWLETWAQRRGNIFPLSPLGWNPIFSCDSG